MELLDVMLHRRSVRQYLPGEIPEEDLLKILQAGLLSPSSRAVRPWELIVIRNQETLQQLSGCRNAPVKMLREGVCAIAVVANATLLDVWVEDCSIVMSNMHLMADALELGSCWIQGRCRETAEGQSTEEYCRNLLGVPENFALEAILSIGVPAERPMGYTVEDLKEEKIHWEKF